MKIKKHVFIGAMLLSFAFFCTACSSPNKNTGQGNQREKGELSGISEALQEEVENINRTEEGVASVELKNMSTSPSADKPSETEKAIVFSDVNETVYVNANDLNLRKGPSTGAEIIKKLNRGEKLSRIGVSEKWSRITYENQTAYVYSQYLSQEKPALQAAETAASSSVSGSRIGLDSSWKYAANSKINTGTAVLYKAQNNRKNITVCVNAGHGTKGGSSVKTLCHPDGTPKVTGGTTAAGATTAVAVSTGMVFADGTTEAAVTLKMAKALKDVLLSRGYDVLMIRETDDVQLDNIARTVIANNTSSCHIALHWDSTSNDKGAFYMGVPDVASYKAMEPVASTWQKHEQFGGALIKGLQGVQVKIFGNGRLPMDLTQTSYSTIASIDIELGDKVSSHSDGTISNLAKGLADGVDIYFGQ